MTLKDVVGALAPFRSLELLAARCLEDGAATLDDVGYVLGRELFDLVGYKALIAAIDTEYLEAGRYAGAGDGAYGRVHAGGVTSRREDTDAFDIAHSLFNS